MNDGGYTIVKIEDFSVNQIRLLLFVETYDKRRMPVSII